MKKITIAMLALAALPFGVIAQDGKKEKVEKVEKIEKTEKAEKEERKKTQEIVIRQKGDKDIKLKVEIDGDNVTINGKPLSEYKDDDVTVSKRKMTIHDGSGMSWDISPDAWSHSFDEGFPGMWNEDGDEETATKAFLGVTTDEYEGGAKVEEVVKGSAAEKAGLKKGDIIKKIDNEKVDGPDELTKIIRSKNPKDEVKVFYKRDGKEASVKAVLGEKKVTKTKSWSFSGPKGKAKAFAFPPNMEGMERLDMLEGLSEIEAPAMAYADHFMFPRQKRIGLKLQDTEDGGGVKVINVEDSSAAATAGLKNDDIITEIDGKKIDNTDDAREQLMPEEGKKGYEIKATRGGTPMTFQVKIPRKLKTANF